MANAPKSRRISLGGKAKTIIPDYTVGEWNGLNTFIKDPTELQDGQSPDSVNWITGRYNDHIELRRGYTLLGTNRIAGSGRVTGLAVATRQDETQVPFFTYGQKINYYDSVADETKEVNTTNILPTAASGEDVAVMPYQSITGNHCYFTSPHSSIYKIEVANPGDVLDLKSNQFRGYAAVNTNRMFLWRRNDAYNQKYNSIIYISVSEGNYTLANYTQTTGKTIGTGDGTTKLFAGTLPSIPALATVFNVEIAGAIAAGTTVTAITKANVAQVTSTAHGLSVGDAVYITGVSGMTQINNVIGIVDTVVDANNVTLSINSSAFTAYSSGGTMYKCEYWNDDKNGKMVSSLGGTGTINYTTGAYSITFITAPLSTIVIYGQYYSETSTTGGIADFTGTGSAVYNEFDGGGDITTIIPFDQVQYAFHLLTTWALNINNSTPSNVPYRSQLGTPYVLGAFSTDDGIIFLDNSVPSLPQIKTLAVSMITASAAVIVVPELISQNLDLSSYGFSQVDVFRWSEYDLIACAPPLNGVVGANNAGIFVRNIYSKQFDYIDIPASCFTEYNGTLLSGDSLSNNVFTLFSGFDDDGANIVNHWTGKMFNLGVTGMKKSNRFVIRGLIQPTQSLNINFSFDSGAFTTFFTVLGTGAYVNTASPSTVGSNTIGSTIVGGGGSVIAYPFEVEFIVNADSFEYVQPQFEATGLGYVQIDNFTFKDNRYKGRKILPTRQADSD